MWPEETSLTAAWTKRRVFARNYVRRRAAASAGVLAALIGAMVALALLLVTSGLQLGGEHPAMAMGAFLAFQVNLAGGTT